MTQAIQAFAPGNLSCFFVIYDHEDVRWKGSTGCGFTVNKGVIVTVSKSDITKIIFNREEMELNPVLYVLEKLEVPPVHVEIVTELPLSSGFGLSGASALATAYAVNALFGLGKSMRELAILAHMADVVCKTGLGDVANQYKGGFCVKFEPSSHFALERLPIDNIPVYVRSYGKLLTASVVGDTNVKEKINHAGNRALEKVKKLQESETLTFPKIISLSKTFVLDSGLLQERVVSKTIEEIEKKGGHASMIMLGKAIFSDVPFDGSTKLFISSKNAHLI